MNKTLVIIIATVIVIGAAYYLGYSHRQPPVIRHVTTNHYTIVDSIPAKITTLQVVDRQTGAAVQTEYAKMDTTITSPSQQSRVDIGIGYNEHTNTFDLQTMFQETIPEPEPRKPRLIGLIGSVGIGFANSLRLHDAELAAGVELKEKYSLSLFGRTDRTYGLLGSTANPDYWDIGAALEPKAFYQVISEDLSRRNR